MIVVFTPPAKHIQQIAWTWRMSGIRVYLMHGMTPIISSTGSCQVTTSEASVI
jgi:hypothetical protein